MSDISICNNALREIGASPITSFHDNTVEAELCNEFYPQTRDELLEDYPWTFAMKRVALVQLAEEPLYEYGNVFQFPSDMLRLHQTDILGNYAVEGNKLLTNAAAVNILYISRVEDPAKFSTLFTHALIKWLVAKLIFPITKRERMIEQSQMNAMRALENAKSADAQQFPGPELRHHILIDVRR